MKLYEFEAGDLFRQEGIPVPDFAVVDSPAQARKAAEKIGVPVVVKAQVLIGGRGLAGGVKPAESPQQAEEFARRILQSSIRGLPVDRVMVVKKAEVAREFYLGVTIDGVAGSPVVILSTSGGVSIEETARTHPEMVVPRQVSISAGLSLPEARQMAQKAGLTGDESARIAEILHRLYNVFRKYDATIAEINPLVCTVKGDYLALDARMDIDDSGLFRHPELQISPEDRIASLLERKGRQIGVTYVELDGEVGIVSSGAGLGMATMDIIGRRYRPANFLETGGGISEELLYRVMELVMQKKGLKAVFLNLLAGINPIHEGARGIVRFLQEHPTSIPIVARARGNRQEEIWQILREGGVEVVTDVATEKSVEYLFRRLEETR
ncbi:MAG: ATP-grasp domain-containing protein [Chloroflexota bacterium]|nr:acetate--CoA ligase family protein [Chloroflexota bacterium]